MNLPPHLSAPLGEGREALIYIAQITPKLNLSQKHSWPETLSWESSKKKKKTTKVNEVPTENCGCLKQTSTSEITRAHSTPTSTDSTLLLPSPLLLLSYPCRNLPSPQPAGTRGQNLTQDSEDAKTLLKCGPEASQINKQLVSREHPPLSSTSTYLQIKTTSLPWSGTIMLSAATKTPFPQLGLCEGVCVPLFNPECHEVRQVESTRNLLLLHLSKNQRSNGHLLQVCQTDAFPKERLSRNRSYKCLGKAQTQRCTYFIISPGQGHSDSSHPKQKASTEKINTCNLTEF